MHGINLSLAVVKTIKAPCLHKWESFSPEQTHRRAGARWVTCHVSTGSLLIGQYTHPSGRPDDLRFSPAPGEDGIWHFSHITHTQVNEEPKQRAGRCVAPALDTWRDTQALPRPRHAPVTQNNAHHLSATFRLRFFFSYFGNTGESCTHSLLRITDISNALFNDRVWTPPQCLLSTLPFRAAI